MVAPHRRPRVGVCCCEGFDGLAHGLRMVCAARPESSLRGSGVTIGRRTVGLQESRRYFENPQPGPWSTCVASARRHTGVRVGCRPHPLEAPRHGRVDSEASFRELPDSCGRVLVGSHHTSPNSTPRHCPSRRIDLPLWVPRGERQIAGGVKTVSSGARPFLRKLTPTRSRARRLAAPPRPPGEFAVSPSRTLR